MTDAKSRHSILLDADVLIDYWNSDRSVLGLMVEHLGTIGVPSLLLEEEARDISTPQDLTILGAKLLEPELSEVFAASSISRAGLSFCDNLCLLMAKRLGFFCATNDTKLRKACKAESIRTIRSLRLLIMLVANQGISANAAFAVAKKMHDNNPKYITEKILQEFTEKIRR
jgi:hypothetical protein